LWQARHVASLLTSAHSDFEVNLLPLSTEGDLVLDSPLAKIGGKDLFVKEIEQALLDGRADLAVHSLKDLPSLAGNGLLIGAFISRASHADLFLSINYPNLNALPEKARIGSSSLRRQAQILALRPDVLVMNLRGNIQTRLKKLHNGEYDAIILAEAGLARLGLQAPYMRPLDLDSFLPALGQGALAVQVRAEDESMQKICAAISDKSMELCARTEWAFMERLGGNCRLPLGGLAQLTDQIIMMRGMVAKPDGSLILRKSLSGRYEDPEALGRKVADELLERGAKHIIASRVF